MEFSYRSRISFFRLGQAYQGHQCLPGLSHINKLLKKGNLHINLKYLLMFLYNRQVQEL